MARKKSSRTITWIVAIITVLLFLEFGAKVALYYHALYRSYTVTKNFYHVEGSFWDFKRVYQQVQSHTVLRPEPYVQDNFNRFFYLPAITGHTQGFMAPAPQPHPKAGAVRVLCMGPSTTEGGYPELLDQILNARVPGRFEVINAGISGAFDINLLMNYLLIWKDLKPHAVLIESNVNEGVLTQIPFTISDRFLKRQDGFDVFQRGMQGRSSPALYRLALFLAKFSLNRQPRLEEPPQEGLDRYRKVLESMAIAVRGSESTPMFLTFQPALTSKDLKGNFSDPFRMEAMAFYQCIYTDLTVTGALKALEAQNEIMRQVALDYDVPLIEASDIIPREDKYFEDGNHHSEEGNRIVAGKVAEALLGQWPAPLAENQASP